MIKSVLINVAEVAQAIGRPPSYLVTYLGQVRSPHSPILTEHRYAAVGCCASRTALSPLH